MLHLIYTLPNQYKLSNTSQVRSRLEYFKMLLNYHTFNAKLGVALTRLCKVISTVIASPNSSVKLTILSFPSHSPTFALVPPSSPLTLVLTHWFLAKACVPEGASEEMERGRSGAERQTPNHSCSSLASPVLSLTSLSKEPAWHTPQLCH